MNAEEDPAPLAMNAILASAGAGGRWRVGDGRCAGLEGRRVTAAAWRGRRRAAAAAGRDEPGGEL